MTRAGAPLAVAACRAAAASPSTVIAPSMPAAAWPGIEHRNDSPAAGTSTAPVASCPASATIVVPSAKVMSCGTLPVLSKATSYRPAAGTVSDPGVKPRSKALISSVPPAVTAFATSAVSEAGEDTAAGPEASAVTGP